MTDLSQQPAAQNERTGGRIRFVTAASLFDGHDASINIMRRRLEAYPTTTRTRSYEA